MIPFAPGLVVKAGLIGAVVVAVVLFGWVIKRDYDSKLIAQVAIKEERATAALQLADAQRTIDGLTKAAETDRARIASLGKLKGSINATRQTRACSGSPAFRALLDGLRPAGGASGGTPAVAGGGVGVPRPAGSAH